MSDKEAAVKRAIEIVNASEWAGDMRVNMTTIIGAGRVLAKENERLRKFVGDQMDRPEYQGCYHMRLEISRLKEMVVDAIKVLKEREPIWATELQDRLNQVP